MADNQRAQDLNQDFDITNEETPSDVGNMGEKGGSKVTGQTSEMEPEQGSGQQEYSDEE